MEQQRSLQCSQEPDTFLCLQPVNPVQTLEPYFPRIHFYYSPAYA
jgi:hypothetical protein